MTEVLRAVVCVCARYDDRLLLRGIGNVLPRKLGPGLSRRFGDGRFSNKRVHELAQKSHNVPPQPVQGEIICAANECFSVGCVNGIAIRRR